MHKNKKLGVLIALALVMVVALIAMVSQERFSASTPEPAVSVAEVTSTAEEAWICSRVIPEVIQKQVEYDFTRRIPYSPSGSDGCLRSVVLRKQSTGDYRVQVYFWSPPKACMISIVRNASDLHHSSQVLEEKVRGGVSLRYDFTVDLDSHLAWNAEVGLEVRGLADPSYKGLGECSLYRVTSEGYGLVDQDEGEELGSTVREFVGLSLDKAPHEIQPPMDTWICFRPTADRLSWEVGVVPYIYLPNSPKVVIEDFDGKILFEGVTKVANHVDYAIRLPDGLVTQARHKIVIRVYAADRQLSHPIMITRTTFEGGSSRYLPYGKTPRQVIQEMVESGERLKEE